MLRVHGERDEAFTSATRHARRVELNVDNGRYIHVGEQRARHTSRACCGSCAEERTTPVERRLTRQRGYVHVMSCHKEAPAVVGRHMVEREQAAEGREDY